MASRKLSDESGYQLVGYDIGQQAPGT